MGLAEVLGSVAALPIGKEFLKAISLIFECGLNNSDYFKRKELKHFLMEEYVRDTQISPIERCAVIDNWNTITREYANKVNIIQKAGSFLDSQKEIQNFDADWLLLFFDKAKNISDEKMQMIWGKLLAEEAQNSGDIPKALLNALSITEGYQAKCFENVCQYCIDTKNGRVVILPIDEKLTTLAHFQRNTLEELDNLGYIRLLQIGYKNIETYFLRGRYHEKIIQIESAKKGISIGQVSLTKMGNILSSIVTRRYTDDFIEMLKEHCDKAKYTLSIS